MKTLQLDDATASILRALLRHHAETTAPEDTMEMLADAMGTDDYDERVASWQDLCDRIAATHEA